MRVALLIVTLTAAPGLWAADEEPVTEEPVTEQPAEVEAGPIRVIVLDLKGSGVDESEIDPITGFITVELSNYPQLEVMSGADVRAMVEFEGEKQALGCDDDTSCLAEVAGAMGARLVFFGTLGRVGSSYTMVLNLYDSEVGRSVGRTFKRGATVDDMMNAVPIAVFDTAGPFLERQGHEVAAPTTTAPPAPPVASSGSPLAILLPVGTLGLGAALVGTGVALDVLLPYSHDKQFQPEFDLWSTALYVAGAGSIVAGAALFFFNPLAE